MQAGVFHSQQVVAGGNARTAAVDHLARCRAVQCCRELVAQLRGRLEASVTAQVVGERPIQRAGNVAPDAIQRFNVAAVARRGASIQQLPRSAIRDGGVVEQHLACVVVQRHLAGRSRWRRARFNRHPCRQPCGVAAIQYRAGHARQAQQPPQPRRSQCAAGRVVTDHLHAGLPAPARQQRAERGFQRQWVPAQAFGRPRQVRQVAIQAGVDGARDMAVPIISFGLVRSGQVETTVHDQHRCRRQGRQFGSFDQGGLQRHVRPILSSRLYSIAAVAPQMRWPPWTNSTIGRW